MADQLAEDRKLIKRICDFAKGMNPREVRFVEDMGTLVLEHGCLLTPKQRAWAETIDAERVE